MWNLEYFSIRETGKEEALFTKLQNLVLIITIFLTPIGCQEISTKEVVTKGGLLYKIGDNEPFSGTVSGYSLEGYRSVKMKHEKRYKNGIRQGDTKFWYSNGKLESVEPYSNGKINGVFTQYYESGHIKARIHMVDGLRGGSKGEQFWYEDETRSESFAKRFFK